MEFTVAVYERRQRASFHWWTLGLGDFNRRRSGRHPGKLRRQLAGDLQKALAKARPAELERCQLPSGIELRHQTLELRLGHGRRRSGRFPIVLAPWPTTRRERLVAAYHPLRQEAWFPYDEDQPLDKQASAFFQQRWRHLDDSQLERLARVKRERLRLIRFNAYPRTLLDQLPRRKKPKKLAIGGARRRRGRLTLLPEIGVDETRAAADEPPAGRSRPPYGELLARRAGGGSPLLVVGPPAVGKSTLIRQWVARLLAEDGYGVHGNLDRCRHVWRFAGRRLIAGMSHVGEWEERALGVVEEASRSSVVLWIEDLHAFGHLGRTVDSDRCLADVFQSGVARRHVRVVGELTPPRLRLFDDDAPAFSALFSRLAVDEPENDETLGLLIHEARRLELDRGVVFAPDVYRTILEVSGSLLVTTALPGKALELLRGLARRHEGSAGDDRTLGPREVLELVARRTGVPLILLEPSETLEATAVEKRLRASVVGQEAGIAAARDLVLRIKTGLVDPRRPYGVLLFTGPTGSGKTELAKALAAYLYGGSRRLLRFDMSEYAGPDAVARLIGERGRPRGQLATAVRQQPFSVVLFDEIEKCHPRVLHLLLQITGDGRLTDAAGDVADFTHAVVVLTSNLGSTGRSRLGFEESSAEDTARAVERQAVAAVEAHFPPELFNRIDRVVPFRPLSRPVARIIARRELERLLGRRGLVERGIFVRATERVLERVTAKGFRADEGARSLKRYLERHVGGPLAELVAGSAGAEMRRVVVHTVGDGFALYSEELREARPSGSESPLAPFLKRSADQVRGELKSALEAVEAMADSPRLAELSERLCDHLALYRIGRTGLADRIYNIDALRDRLGDLGDRLERQIAAAEPDLGEQIEIERFAFLVHSDSWDPRVHRRVRVLDRRAFGDLSQLAGKAELLALLAEAHFLRRALTRVEDPRRHAVFVELSHVGGAASGQATAEERFAGRREGLLEWLAAAYGTARGELEEFAASFAEGAVERGEHPRVLTLVLERLPHRVVLKLAGLSVLDRFAGEHGCHVRTRRADAPEIVRVAVRPAPPEATAAEELAAGEAIRRRFVDALEAELAGGELPPNPEELLPVVRRYHYDPAEGGAPALCEVEDYLLCHAAGHRVRSFAEVLAVLALLHQTVEPVGAGRG